MLRPSASRVCVLSCVLSTLPPRAQQVDCVCGVENCWVACVVARVLAGCGSDGSADAGAIVTVCAVVSAVVSQQCHVVARCACVCRAAGDASSLCTSFRHGFTCAVYGEEGRLLCWQHGTGATRSPPEDGEHHYVSVSCKGSEVVGVLRSGGLGWSVNLWAPERRKGTHGAGPANDVYVEWYSMTGEGRFVESNGGISAQEDSTCLLRSSHRPGQMICWPGTEELQDSFGGRYIAVSKAESTCFAEGTCVDDERASTFCVVSRIGEIECCCGDEESLLMTQVPEGDTFVDVSVGIEHACALSSDGGLACWGEDIVGRMAPPLYLPQLGQMVDASLTGGEADKNSLENLANAGGNKFSQTNTPIGAGSVETLRWTAVAGKRASSAFSRAPVC